MGGLSIKSLRIHDKPILGQTNFGKKHKEMDGKAIKRKAEETLRRCKKYYGYWKEFLVLDQFPSGKDEDDALKHVISREFNDQRIHTGEIESEDDDEVPLTGSVAVSALSLSLSELSSSPSSSSSLSISPV